MSEKTARSPQVIDASASNSDGLNKTLQSVRSDFVVLAASLHAMTPGVAERATEAVRRFPDTDLVYGDSVSPSNSTLLDRPAFSPLRLRSQYYLGDVLVVRTELLQRVGGFRSGLEGAHLYDIALRLTAAGARILHLPISLSYSDRAGELLISRRSDRDRPAEPHGGARVRAVRDHLAELNIAADLTLDDRGEICIRYLITGHPRVSLIIPTRGSRAIIAGKSRVLVTEAVRGILKRSTYSNLEIVVVADDDTPQSAIDELINIAGGRLRLVRWTEPFNFSAKINRGAVCATGDYLLPLNDDIELITGDWLERMIGLAQQSQIGIVGTSLFFEDGSIQHAGHLYRGGAAGHVALGWDSSWDDRLGAMAVEREVSGVTAACAMVRASTYWEVGGFSALLPGNYNDVDFCMKIRSKGLSAVWTPHVRLYHFESKSRVATIAPTELKTIRSRWESKMQTDAYWSLP